MLGLKLNHVNKRGPRWQNSVDVNILDRHLKYLHLNNLSWRAFSGRGFHRMFWIISGLLSGIWFIQKYTENPEMINNSVQIWWIIQQSIQDVYAFLFLNTKCFTETTPVILVVRNMSTPHNFNHSTVGKSALRSVLMELHTERIH